MPLLPLGASVVLLIALALHLGPSSVGLQDFVQALQARLGLASSPGAAETILFDVRLPRVLLGIGVGSGLAVSGALMQAIFRNPLAEPGLVGVSSGAAFGAATAIVFGQQLGLPKELDGLTIPLLAALGGALATLAVQRLARRGARTSTASLLLAGLGISAFVNACLGIAIHLASDAQLRSLTFWMLGSLGGASLRAVSLALPVLLLPVVMAPRLAPRLDALLLGEREAQHLGVDVERLKRRVVVLTALSVGTAVAMAGVIGFVGLLVPHAIRLLQGPGHRALLPRSALGGAGLLLFTDLISRVSFAPLELPIGALTAFIGAPFFLMLLIQEDRKLAP